MVILDTNVVVALLDERDGHRQAAVTDLNYLLRRKQRLATTTTVLCEACHLLRALIFRERLAEIIQRTPIQVLPSLPDWNELLRWLVRYGEHKPDWVDAELVLLSASEIATRDGVRIWTYDREFRTTWRRPDGSRVPLAVQRRT